MRINIYTTTIDRSLIKLSFVMRYFVVALPFTVWNRGSSLLLSFGEGDDNEVVTDIY